MRLNYESVNIIILCACLCNNGGGGGVCWGGDIHMGVGTQGGQRSMLAVFCWCIPSCFLR